MLPSQTSACRCIASEPRVSPILTLCAEGVGAYCCFGT